MSKYRPVYSVSQQLAPLLLTVHNVYSVVSQQLAPLLLTVHNQYYYVYRQLMCCAADGDGDWSLCVGRIMVMLLRSVPVYSRAA